MKIELREISVRDLALGYSDDAELGVRAYGGKLDVRPAYQREFIYKDKQREAVIDTITKGFPLNVMYWATRDDGTFEVIDGQQRTISLCQYVQGEFSVKDIFLYQKADSSLYFHNLTNDQREKILNYKLMVYVCSGTDSDKLKWFETINIAGEKLTKQELRNAVYSGSWVADAKRYFSKTGCAASAIGSDYLTGSAIRQDYLETAIDWLSKGKIDGYMAVHQHDPNANALWAYFSAVINWVNMTFPQKRKKEMNGVDWGGLYDQFKDKTHDLKALEKRIKALMEDDDVTNKKGIYAYVLTNDEKHLNIRGFTESMKRKVYEKQNGICKICGEHFDISEMEADHIDPWHSGGKTNEDNCQMLCKSDNRRKSGK
jgi:hypothetical protein